MGVKIELEEMLEKESSSNVCPKARGASGPQGGNPSASPQRQTRFPFKQNAEASIFTNIKNLETSIFSFKENMEAPVFAKMDPAVSLNSQDLGFLKSVITACQV